VWAVPDTNLGLGRKKKKKKQKKRVWWAREKARKGGQRNVTVVGRFDFEWAGWKKSGR